MNRRDVDKQRARSFITHKIYMRPTGYMVEDLVALLEDTRRDERQRMAAERPESAAEMAERLGFRPHGRDPFK